MNSKAMPSRFLKESDTAPQQEQRESITRRDSLLLLGAVMIASSVTGLLGRNIRMNKEEERKKKELRDELQKMNPVVEGKDIVDLQNHPDENFQKLAVQMRRRRDEIVRSLAE